MPQDIPDREDFYKDSSNKQRKSSGNKSFSELLSFSDYQGSAATTPSGRDNKSGWYDIHKKHVNLLLNSKTILVLIEDSIVAGLSRYANIWQTFIYRRRSHAACAVACRKCDSSKFFEICSHTLWYQ